MKSISALLICVSAAILVGCEEPQPSYGTYQSGPYAGVSSPGQYSTVPPTTQGVTASDRVLASQIRQAFNESNVPGDTRAVNVLVQNGSVTLTGAVSSESQRHQVDELVRSISGVSSVYDQMQIGPSPTASSRTYSPGYAYGGSAQVLPPTGRPEPIAYANTMATGDIFSLHVQGLNETDRSVAERILQGLRTDTTLNTLLPIVNITVTSGRVVLQGTVQNEQQRQTIGAVVQRAAGAGNVENDLQVVGP